MQETRVEFSNYKQYKAHFKNLVQLERQEEINRHMHEIKSMSGQKRESAGRAILNLSGRDSGKGLGGTYLIKFVRQGGLPFTDIAVGDLVIVSTGNPDGKEPQGTVIEKTNHATTVAFNSAPPKYAYKKNLRLDLFANDITYQRMLEALKQVKNNDGLLQLLTEQRTPGFEQVQLPNYVNPDLNDSQKEAVHFSRQASDCYLIHGPPGTGKTTTLVEAILQHAKDNQRILVTADSNIAVDNLVEKIHEQGFKVIRIGNPARINQDLVEHALDYQLENKPDFKEAKQCWQQVDALKEQQKNHEPATGQNRRGLRDSQIKKLAEEGKTSRGIPPGKLKSMGQWLAIQEKISEWAEKAKELEDKATHEILGEAEVICTTNASAGIDLLQDYQFDVVFIDEATQATEPACLIPMVKGRKFVMAGDHKQLPPTVLNQEAKPYLQQTLFERWISQLGDDIRSMLEVQYRMHEQIMAFSNEHFYEGRLVAHESVASHTISGLNIVEPKHSASWVQEALAPEKVNVFLDTAHLHFEEQAQRSFSYRNEYEADVLVQLANKLLGMGLPAKSLGLISPYDDQVNLLKSKMEHPSHPEIKTVDGFQGREKEVILLSFVRSNEQGKLGFLTDYRRLNVAITRARRKLVMVGDGTLLNKDGVYEKMLNYSKKHKFL